MDNIKFSVKIDENDLYRFNLHHIYTSSQGILSVVLCVLLIAVWILRFSVLTTVYKIFYPLVAIIVLLYIPMSLKIRVRAQMQQEVFMHPLTYELGEDAIEISSPTTDEPAQLPWEYIYKISTWKGYLLIYSNRINAYIIPIESVKEQYDTIIAYMKTKLEDYKLQIK